MKNYLSFGGGVNSVALYLVMQDMGIEFEAVYVDHGCDWPETREYVKNFSIRYPLTIIKPNFCGFDNLYEYSMSRRILPDIFRRWCTDNFKRQPFNSYVDSPCFVFIGYAADEEKRAKISTKGGIEYRWPLIEEGIDREGCKKIIREHGEEVPIKSGCFLCPFQRVGQFRLLRRKHPDLFCKIEKLERVKNERADEEGLSHRYLLRHPIGNLIQEKQRALPGMEAMEYPPCECGL